MQVFEFMDTIIMCLRCRFRQITFLHVYHHASIFAIWWAIVKYYPGGGPASCRRIVCYVLTPHHLRGVLLLHSELVCTRRDVWLLLLERRCPSH